MVPGLTPNKIPSHENAVLFIGQVKFVNLFVTAVTACNFDSPELQYVKTLLLQGKTMEKIFDTYLLHKMALQYRDSIGYRIC